MQFILRVIGGLVLAGFGVLPVVKTQWFVENFGSIEWAEQNLGSGGTWLFYKLLGVLLCIIGLLLATGLLGGLLLGTVGRLFLPPGAQQ